MKFDITLLMYSSSGVIISVGIYIAVTKPIPDFRVNGDVGFLFDHFLASVIVKMNVALALHIRPRVKPTWMEIGDAEIQGVGRRVLDGFAVEVDAAARVVVVVFGLDDAGGAE
jgi:hypothetical protein